MTAIHYVTPNFLSFERGRFYPYPSTTQEDKTRQVTCETAIYMTRNVSDEELSEEGEEKTDDDESSDRDDDQGTRLCGR